MPQIKKGDTVYVITGKDKGSRGKVLRVLDKEHVLVEGVMRQKRHQKANAKVMQGGIITKEGPVHISNVMVYCTACHRPSRIRHLVGDNGKKIRVCSHCDASLE